VKSDIQNSSQKLYVYYNIGNLIFAENSDAENDSDFYAVGTDAEEFVNQPTMFLNLHGHTANLQKSIVIHEFGHALGLEHEHQRSDFWDNLEEFFDIKEMKKNLLHIKAFKSLWYRRYNHAVNTVGKYDPNSIMHFRYVILFHEMEGSYLVILFSKV